jgi:hypothetical protein
MRRTDKVFMWFAGALFVLVGLFGAGTTAVVLWGDPKLALRMINVLAAMFSALVGLGTGYLFGSRPLRQEVSTPEVPPWS